MWVTLRLGSLANLQLGEHSQAQHGSCPSEPGGGSRVTGSGGSSHMASPRTPSPCPRPAPQVTGPKGWLRPETQQMTGEGGSLTAMGEAGRA